MAQVAAAGGTVADLLATMDRHLESALHQQPAQPQLPQSTEAPQATGENPGGAKPEPPTTPDGLEHATPLQAATPRMDDSMDGARGVKAAAATPTGTSPPTKRAKAVSVVEPTPAEAAAAEVKTGQ